MTVRQQSPQREHSRRDNKVRRENTAEETIKSAERTQPEETTKSAEMTEFGETT